MLPSVQLSLPHLSGPDEMCVSNLQTLGAIVKKVGSLLPWRLAEVTTAHPQGITVLPAFFPSGHYCTACLLPLRALLYYLPPSPQGITTLLWELLYQGSPRLREGVLSVMVECVGAGNPSLLPSVSAVMHTFTHYCTHANSRVINNIALIVCKNFILNPPQVREVCERGQVLCSLLQHPTAVPLQVHVTPPCPTSSDGGEVDMRLQSQDTIKFGLQSHTELLLRNQDSTELRLESHTELMQNEDSTEMRLESQGDARSMLQGHNSTRLDGRDNTEMRLQSQDIAEPRLETQEGIVGRLIAEEDGDSVEVMSVKSSDEELLETFVDSSPDTVED